MAFLEVSNISVGYPGKCVIKDCSFIAERGKVLVLAGPNGGGKTTLLKALTGHLPLSEGKILLEGKDINEIPAREFARMTAAVFTKGREPEMMTCLDVAVMGRYPYTDILGRRNASDRKAAIDALDTVGASDWADRDFGTLSDGQKQRVRLAAAVCQEPSLLVLDEPTSYLDWVQKLELAELLRELCRRRNMACVMSLHEMDLALKCADGILGIDGKGVSSCASPEEASERGWTEKLFGAEDERFDPVFGGGELRGNRGEPSVFVIAGSGDAVPLFRALARRKIPFATGILPHGGTEHRVAGRMTGHCLTSPPFAPVDEALFLEAAGEMKKCERVILASGDDNDVARRLIHEAEKAGLEIRKEI